MSASSEYFSIKNWSESDRPREKLLLKGKENLSDAELLAILIGSGSRNESAVSLCKRILKDNEHKINQLAKLDVKQLMQYKGIGEAKAISIVAALELGRRRRGEEALQRPKIKSSATVFEVMQPLIGDLPHEEFWVLLLNNSNKIIHKFALSKGGITGTLVDLRLLFKNALAFGCVSLILAHNHPSGNLNPSASDIKLTKQIKEGSLTLDLKLLDHLIITEKSYYSFADEAIL
ncbi:RadC family protein [Psychroflexus planctonicus]|uniref:DNA repair protein RadC n=1 Tax=Psychroflexus planctonicus TaxID=1526575 RepID=A0ABQ1SIH3_9FLAO|nr:DNA repair protein RadC [Psychroflexus planctonicus]GGE37654.1 DNA repair protein RadC [Psychroflexus planctonicus]